MDWQAAKIALVIGGLLVLWFANPIASGLVSVWRVWNGKSDSKTRTGKNETML